MSWNTRRENILPCLGVERYVPRSTFLIRRTAFFRSLSFCRLRAISSRVSIENRFSREYLSEICFVSNLPLPPLCSRRSICRSGRRSRADNRTYWWNWSGRPWVSCSRRVLKSRCLTHISLLPFCASRSLLLPLSLLLPCAQRVPSSSSRHFYLLPAVLYQVGVRQFHVEPTIRSPRHVCALNLHHRIRRFQFSLWLSVRLNADRIALAINVARTT